MPPRFRVVNHSVGMMALHFVTKISSGAICLRRSILRSSLLENANFDGKKSSMKRHTTLLTASVAVAGLAVVISGAMADQLMAQDEPPAPPFAIEAEGPEGPRHGRRGHHGPLTREQAVENALTMFDRHDVDGNGEVSQAELTAHIQERAVDRAARGFDRRDTNDDGVITEAEMTTLATRNFDRMDTDGDGVVTNEERRQMHEALMAVSGRHPR